MNRLIIQIEFKKSSLEELELYKKLKEYSSPGSIIKDILRGKIPISILRMESEGKDSND